MLTALDVLGYERPTKLRGERARLVGLVLPELQNPIFPAFAEVVAGALAKRGFTPVLCTRTEEGVSEADYVDMLLDQHVSGVIFAGGLYAQADADHEHYRRLLERGLPVVLVNAAIDGIGFPTVSADDAVAVRAGVRASALARARPDRPGPRPGGPRAVLPQAGRRAAIVAGLGTVPTWSQSARSSRWRVARQPASRLLKRGVTGVICASDVLALGAVRAARRLGMSVPGDVSVVGYDDSAFMACTDPPLTTIRQPIEAMGQAAVSLLVNQVGGNDVPAEELFFDTELVVRGSTAPAKIATTR